MAETLSNDPADANNPDVAYEASVVVEQGVPATDESVESEEVVAEPQPEESTPPAEAAPEETPKQQKMERRFSELTQRMSNAERMAEAERLEKERLQEELAQYKQSPPNKPQYENFSDPYSYAEALAQWEAAKASKDTENKIRQEYREKEERARQATWQQRINEAKKDYDDYEDVVLSATAIISDEIKAAILDSELGPHLLYKLADDDALVSKLARLPTASALRELGKIEASIELSRQSKPQKSVKGSSAPEPISPLRSTNKLSAESYRDAGDVAIINDNADNYRRLRIAGKVR